MQISSISITTPLPVEKTRLSPSGKAATDQAVINFSPDTFSSLVNEAGQMPEVRSEVVDAYKARIQAGQYPSEDVVSGLTDLIGGSIVHLAASESSAS